MAMRKTSSVSLTFADQMVSIPVGIYKAVSEKDIKFNNLHRECSCQTKMKRYCPTCNPAGDGPELESTTLVKGYQISKGSFVKLEESDFDAIPLGTLKSIEIQEFVGAETLDDPRYFEESYFVAPEATGTKFFSLIFQAAENQDKIAICKMVLREKEHIAALRPFKDGVMLLQTLYYSDELKDHSELKQNKVAASEKELSMANRLVEALSVKDLDLTKFKDGYREALTELIEKKAAGEVITPVAEKPVLKGDDMAMLENMLNDVLSKPKATAK